MHSDCFTFAISSQNKEVVRGLTLKDLTSPSNQTFNTQAVAGSNTIEDQDATRIGGLTETDIKRFTAPCTYEVISLPLPVTKQDSTRH